MLTKQDYDMAREIVSRLQIPDKFGAYGDALDFDTYELEEQISRLLIGGFHITNGVSKAVIIPDSFDFVIKIPFNGLWIENYDRAWNEEEEEYEDDEDAYIFEYFSGANAPDSSDYCWDEMIKINAACDNGFEALFPQTDFLGEFNDVKFYIQEKVEVARGCVCHTKPSNESLDRSQSIAPRYQICSVEWRAVVIEMYGESFWTTFVNWNDSTNNNMLTDMHAGNYGYTFEGAPVLLDVAGYNDY